MTADILYDYNIDYEKAVEMFLNLHPRKFISLILHSLMVQTIILTFHYRLNLSFFLELFFIANFFIIISYR